MQLHSDNQLFNLFVSSNCSCFFLLTGECRKQTPVIDIYFPNGSQCRCLLFQFQRCTTIEKVRRQVRFHNYKGFTMFVSHIGVLCHDNYR